MDWLQTLGGALTGFLVGLTGVGGGALMTPLLLLLFGVAPLTAVGTDLWFAAITKLFATRIHHGHGLIDWPVVKLLWLGSLSMSTLTLLWMKLHPVDQSAVALLKASIAFALVLTSVAMLYQKTLHAVGRKLRTAKAGLFKEMQPWLTVVAGGILGVLVTLTSVGAGAIGVVFLGFLYPLRLTPPRLIATDIVHAIPLAVFAGIGHLLIGNVNFLLLGNLLLGSIPGVIAGAKLSARLPHALLRRLLAAVLMAIGGKLIWTLMGR